MNETIIEKTTIRNEKTSQAEMESDSECRLRRMAEAAGEIAAIACQFGEEFGENRQTSTALAVLKMAKTSIKLS